MATIDNYNPNSWYWLVGSNTTEVFFSGTGQLIPTSDPAYSQWLAASNLPSRIASFSDLYDVLSNQAPNALISALTTLINSSGLNPTQMSEAMLNRGITITSTATPALNGTYSLSSSAWAKISAIASGLGAGNRLPDGTTSVGITDTAGVVHNFAKADFLNLSEAMEDFIYNVYAAEAAAVAGHAISWPQATATIP